MSNADFSCALYIMLEQRILVLITRAKWLKRHQPDTYKTHPHFKLLQSVWRVMKESWQDPGHARYNLGNTLGAENRHWRRCKEGLPPRYRLFFRFSSSERVCVYAWLNDEKTLRKAGSKTDVYATFKHLLNKGLVPQNFAELLIKSKLLTTDQAEKLTGIDEGQQ